MAKRSTPAALSALDRAVVLLARRARTRQELDGLLRRQGVPAQERREALARARELGYIDDAATLRARAQRRIARGESPGLVARRLVACGATRADAEEAAAEAAEGASDESLARRAAKALSGVGDAKGAQEQRRLWRALLRKGYRPSVAAKALGMDWEGDDGADDVE